MKFSFRFSGGSQKVRKGAQRTQRNTTNTMIFYTPLCPLCSIFQTEIIPQLKNYLKFAITTIEKDA